MRFERSIWLSLLVPTLICGLAVALVALWVLGSPAAAIFVVGACLVSTVGNALTVSRNAHDASALLRRRTLRGSSIHRTGVYHLLLDEATSLLEHFERGADEAGRLHAELEAKLHMRQRELEQLEAALDCIGVPLLVTDNRDELLFCNADACRILAPAEETAAANDPSRGVDLERLPAVKRLLADTRCRAAANSRRTAEFDWRQGTDDRVFRAAATHITDAAGCSLGVVTLLQCIGEERRERTRHAEFVSSVCHELKTPMASIKAFTEMLMDGEITERDEQCELLGFIDEQVDRLTRLVNNMLNLTRVESGVIKVQREDCELNDVLHKAFGVVQQLAAEKQIRLIPELSELYLAVHLDRDLFGQAVINLLSNAVKYTPAGGEVRLRSRMDEDQAVIEVRDTGMGIPAESLPRLFQRFYRVPENNHAAAGTGLGLALVHYIVAELHNGSIAIDSVVERGSCFTITIPLGHRQAARRRPGPPLYTA